MILEELRLKDFRVFQGEHSFELTPKTKYEKKRPIVLFGGLNGAGKTSILTAIRLALYGKQSLGFNASQKQYDDYLLKTIHQSRNAVVLAASSEIHLTFSYAHMGVLRHYTVRRNWMMSGKKLVEALHILENGKALSELNYEQCQGFLNELIPIGVSDLFFFDGEKIAELAEDKNGVILGDSIKKLLGLDLIETLNTDLAAIQRSESKKAAPVTIQKELEIFERELSSIEGKAEQELQQYEDARKVTQEAETLIARLENELLSKGGAWATSRELEISNKARLDTEKKLIESNLINAFSGSYPLSLAPNFTQKLLSQLKLEAQQKKNSDIATVLEERLSSLNTTLKALLNPTEADKTRKAIDKEFKKLLNPKTETTIIHDISESFLSTVETIINDAFATQSANIQTLSKKLSSITQELEQTSFNIARVPEEAQIKPVITMVSEQQEKRANSRAKQRRYIDNYKRLLREAMDVTRSLDRLSENSSSEDKTNRVLQYVTSSRGLLTDFAKEMTKRKVKDLEHELITSLHKFSRKDDAIIDVKIDPENFSVKLLGHNGNELNKNDLSAGEKQIYAIAILEALARTSGRKLPIIIDTPLGRLDSVHRSKLIKSYFPYASHQVIILSTDTEVDKAYYEDFSKHISHAFKLDYSPEAGNTNATEGYFWKPKHAKAV